MSEHFQNQTEKSIHLTHKACPINFQPGAGTAIKRDWIELYLCFGPVACVCLRVALSGTYCVVFFSPLLFSDVY